MMHLFLPLLLKLAALNFFLPSASAEVVEKILAIVNDQNISKTELENYSNSLRKDQLVDDLLIPDKKALLSSQEKLLSHFINEKIIDSEVRRQNLEATSERVEQEVTSITARNHVTRSQLRESLQRDGVSFSRWLAFIKQRLERQSLIERAVRSKIKISDEDIAAQYISEKKDGASTVFEYRIAQILALPQGGEVAAAESRIKDAFQRLKRGESFESVAEDMSEDPQKGPGGFLGSFKSGEFLKELESGVKNVSVGQYSLIVRSKVGFHILKVLQKKLVPDPEFEKSKETIRAQLSEREFKRQFNFWLDQRRQEADILFN